jgi:hypothetical protein
MLRIGVGGVYTKPVIRTWFGKNKNYECTSYTTYDITEIKKILSGNYQTCIGVLDVNTVSTLEKRHLIEVEDTISLFEEKGIKINRLSDEEYIKHVTNDSLELNVNDQLIYLERDMSDISDGHDGYLWEIYITIYTVVKPISKNS